MMLSITNSRTTLQAPEKVEGDCVSEVIGVSNNGAYVPVESSSSSMTNDE